MLNMRVKAVWPCCLDLRVHSWEIFEFLSVLEFRFAPVPTVSITEEEEEGSLPLPSFVPLRLSRLRARRLTTLRGWEFKSRPPSLHSSAVWMLWSGVLKPRHTKCTVQNKVFMLCFICIILLNYQDRRSKHKTDLWLSTRLSPCQRRYIARCHPLCAVSSRREQACHTFTQAARVSQEVQNAVNSGA